MRIRSAIGMGIAIVIFRYLTPHVWVAFESALISFFSAAHDVLAVSADLVGRAGSAVR